MKARTVTLALLLGLAALTSLPAQLLPTPLEVEVVLDPDMDAMFVDGQAVPQDVHVTVTHDGGRASTAYEVVYEWQFPNGDRMPLRGTREESTASGDPMLPGDDPRKHTLRWTPLETVDVSTGEDLVQVGAGAVVVTVREGSTTIQPEPIPVFVEDHAFSLSLPETDPLSVSPGQTIHVPIDVRNDGNVDEELTWSVVQSHSRLQVSFLESPQTVPLDPPTTRATLAISYTSQGSTVDERDIVLTARATTPEGVTRFIETPEIDILHDEEPSPPAFSLDGPDATVFTSSEAPVDVTFTLKNEGTQPDTYSFTRAATNGWNAGAVTLDGQTVQGLSLAAGASRDLVVTVTPDAQAQRLSSLTVTATSQASSTTATATAALAIGGVLPVINGVAFTADPLYRDDPASVRVAYQNVGNVAMEDASLTVRVEYANGASSSKTVALDDLLPGRDRTATLDLGAAKAPGQAVLTATLTAGDEAASGTNPAFVHSGLLKVIAPKPLAGAPGELVRYHTPPHAFQVRNDGNAPEAITVTVLGADVLGEETFTLQPGQARTVAVTQDVPDDVGDAGKVPVRLAARLDDAPQRSDEAVVHTPVQDTTPPTVTWTEAPTAMLPSDARPLRVHVEDDTFVLRTWVDITHLDPDDPDAEGTDGGSVQLHEADDWIGLLRSGLPALLKLTPRAEDAFGNVGTGPSRTVTVSHAPPPPPTPVTIDSLDYANGTLTVRTNASSLTLLVDGEETTHDVVDGELVVELPLGTGKHLIEVVVEGLDGEVRENATVEIPAVADEPGLLARLVPGPGVGFVVAAVAMAVVLRRCNRSGP